MATLLALVLLAPAGNLMLGPDFPLYACTVIWLLGLCAVVRHAGYRLVPAEPSEAGCPGYDVASQLADTD